MKTHLHKLIATFLFAAAPAVVPAQVVGTATVGGLTLEASQQAITTANANVGTVKGKALSFRVLHKGKPVTYSDGKSAQSPLVFWEAWTLPDAPRPAILAANRATYLITEENGEARVQLLRGESDRPASWQWLDAGGKIGDVHDIYIRDAMQGPLTLRGGTSLVVSSAVLLDVKTLQSYPMRFSGEFEMVKQANGYSASNKGVLLYSASARQAATLGRNEAAFLPAGSINNPEHAMVVLDLATQTRYAVPFDRNQMRLAQEYEDATPAWAATHFEWRVDAQGRQRLQPRKHAKPVPWMGRFRNVPREGDDASNTTYVLMPADGAMVEPLVKLIERELGGRKAPLLSDEQPEYKTRMEINGFPVSIVVMGPQGGAGPSVEVATDVPTMVPVPGSPGKLQSSYNPDKIRATNQQVMKLGEQINKLLAQGKLQEFFTSVPKRN